jgi:hypothetical protein
MNNKDRFMDTMLFKDTRCVPNHEIALWGQTLDRWENEGLPKGVLKYDGWFLEGEPYFGFEPFEYIKIDSTGPLPENECSVLEENDRIIVFTDGRGVTHRALKEGISRNVRMSMDQYIGFPVTDRDSFRSWKKRFTPDMKTRYPADWDEKVKHWNVSDEPLVLLDNGQFGYYSMLRSWMGVEALSYMLHDDPDLIHEMLGYLTEYIIELTGRALDDIRIDYFNIWEDMSYKNGPLVSPEMFREFFLPHYRKLIDHMKSHGVKLITVDTDGDPRKLVPLFMEAGVNGLWPVEVASGIDPVMLRKEFGSDLALMGGIDKRLLACGKAEIRSEVQRILDYMLPRGGYIPTVDHMVPPDVSYENFLYYLDIKKRALEGKM